MKNSETQTQYTAVARNNQLVLILNSEIKLPEDAPVRVTSAQLEELDYLHTGRSAEPLLNFAGRGNFAERCTHT